MGRPTNEEAKKKRRAEQMRIGAQRFRDTHKGMIKTFKAELSSERYDQIDKALRENGMTKKEFIENAINQYLQAKNKA